jgi:hypothetical protein
LPCGRWLTLLVVPPSVVVVSIFCAEMMKEGAHLPHYFVTREGARLDNTAAMQVAVEDFIARRDERQVQTFESMLPVIVNLAISKSTPSRMKGLTQLLEAAQRPLLHPLVLRSLGPVYEALLSGVHDVATAGAAVVAALAVVPGCWTDLSRHGIMRALCEPRFLDIVPGDGQRRLQRHVACIVTHCTSKARGRRLWKQESQVAAMLSRLLHSSSDATVDATLAALCSLCFSEADIVCDALTASPGVTATLCVLVRVLRSPTVRSMRCVAGILSALVGPAGALQPHARRRGMGGSSGGDGDYTNSVAAGEHVLHADGVLMLVVFMWGWSMGVDAPLGSDASLSVFHAQLLHVMWEYARGHVGAPLNDPDASVEAEAIKICVGVLQRYCLGTQTAAGGPPLGIAVAADGASVGGDVAFECVEAALGVLAYLCSRSASANYTAARGVLPVLNELLRVLPSPYAVNVEAKAAREAAVIARTSDVRRGVPRQPKLTVFQRQMQAVPRCETGVLDRVLPPRQTAAGLERRRRLLQVRRTPTCCGVDVRVSPCSCL